MHTYGVLAHATSPYYYSHYMFSQMFYGPCSHLILFCSSFMWIFSPFRKKSPVKIEPSKTASQTRRTAMVQAIADVSKNEEYGIYRHTLNCIFQDGEKMAKRQKKQK